ncbi:SDR family oxidoreductase [Pseudoduganella sp. S-14]|jgi:NAD(P)-dependent dehydrogenase (short-subunit alcohol dehydrogenase family)|uniref:SDR family oxidoreductase n=1 Tax=Pseudoduganella sp. S-14 TaxID=3404065 RepID=UPI003CEE72F9
MTTILITGAAGALGSAVARAFDDAGTNTVLIGRETARLESACGPASARRMLAVADLRDAASVAAAANAAVQRFGRIDVLCNIAGGFAMGTPVHATTDAQWDELFDFNVRSLRNTVAAVVPGMLDGLGGKVVNIASGSARQGMANMGAYCASKDVVIRLTESMSAELRGHGINVNCVLPGTIDTPDNRAAMPNADRSKWVPPEALADVILYLCSPAARAIHGAAIPCT